jgi:hypothetical protein
MDKSQEIDREVNPELVIQTILDEIYKAVGVSTDAWFRKLIDPILRLPVNRFAEICSGLNNRIGSEGLSAGAKSVLPFFVKDVRYSGRENIPSHGPLLVISNHPGGVDSVCITAGLERDDLKIIAYEVPFYHTLPNVSKHFIYATDHQSERMTTLRESIRHLQKGGSLLLFGTGVIDPDPTVEEGAEKDLENWSLSIPFIIRKVPGIQVILCIAGGVVAPQYVNHPITRLRQKPIDRRRLAEFLQILNQVVFRKTLNLRPSVYFSEVILPGKINPAGPDNAILAAFISSAKQMLEENHRSGVKDFENLG